MKRPRLLIALIIIVILALAVVRVTVENSISTTGIELMKMQERLAVYKKDNSLIQEKYLASSALINIAAKAQRNGFAESKNQVYLSTPLPLALGQ